MQNRHIAFSPPDVGEEEVEAVAEALRSGWITTGPKTKQLERELKDFTQADGFACLASATAALECCLRAVGIGPGDEVITSAYTYTASCSPICHIGATPVLCDTAADSYEMDYEALAGLITERTKAIIPVDLGGRMCDYNRLFAALESRKADWRPTSDLQNHFGRPLVICDAAHSLGASYQGVPSGAVADFTTFSFHAVKNFTTAEGGGLSWRTRGFNSEDFYQEIMLLSLHGQTKDALSKNKVGVWEYDVMYPGWKCNMTDIQAALGLTQLRRYPSLLARRREMIERYEAGLTGLDVSTLTHFSNDSISSGHLMLVHMNGKDEAFRNAVIEHMAQAGVATNVHYKPLPLLSAYRNLGFSIDDFPNAYELFRSEITFPLHTLLTNDDIDYVLAAFKNAYVAVANEV